MICIKCENEIPPKRLEILPNTKTCVNCSTASSYRAVTTVNGTGDNTWNDIQIMNDDEYSNFEKQEEALKKTLGK